jgi:glycosyltransferase involved in cell wall biosynthesis
MTLSSLFSVRRRERPGRAVQRLTILNWRDTTHPEGGGSERYVERIASGLSEQGWQVVVRCARYPGSARLEHRNGFVLRRAGGPLTVYPRAVLGLVVDRGLRRRNDVVLEVQNGVPFLARPFAGCRVVILVHHVHREQWPVALGPVGARIGWWLESRLAPWVNRGLRYVTVSDVSRRELTQLGVDPTAISVVHNGVDPLPGTRSAVGAVTAQGAGPVADGPVLPDADGPALPDADVPALPDADGPALPDADGPVLVVLGRLVPHKRVEHALVLAARLAPRHPGLRLRVVGDGWWRKRLVDQARRLGIADITEFLGFVSEARKHEILTGSTVLLAPSLKEGWGLMVVEAAQHGVPSVAYRDAGGLSESIVDGATGILVDDIEEMVRATERLLTDPELRQQMGEAARKRANGFNWHASTLAFAEVLRSSTEVADAARRKCDIPTSHVASPAGLDEAGGPPNGDPSCVRENPLLAVVDDETRNDVTRRRRAGDEVVQQAGGSRERTDPTAERRKDGDHEGNRRASLLASVAGHPASKSCWRFLRADVFAKVPGDQR